MTQNEQLFYTLVWKPLVAAGEGALFAAFPILDAPVLGTIDNEVIQLTTDALFNRLILFVSIESLKLKNTALQSAYDTQSELLAVVVLEKGIGSPEYVQAEAAAVASMSAVVKLSV